MGGLGPSFAVAPHTHTQTHKYSKRCNICIYSWRLRHVLCKDVS